MCFSWKPGCAAINQGRHFHAPHFSWFLSEFPPFLSHSTLAPELPTAALAADHSQRGIRGWPGPSHPSSKAFLVVLGLLSQWRIPQRICHLDGTVLFHHPSQIIHCLHACSWWPTVISSKLKALWPTALCFNVAMKEPFYCRLQTVVLSQPCVVYAVICEGCRGLVLIRAVKWQWSDSLPVSIEAEFTEWCTHW